MPSNPADAQPREWTLTPSYTSAATPFDASAFISTTDHLPSPTFHVSAVGPEPVAEATQMPCAAGRGGFAVPRTRSYLCCESDFSKSLRFACATLARYALASLSRAIPMNRGRPV